LAKGGGDGGSATGVRRRARRPGFFPPSCSRPYRSKKRDPRLVHGAPPSPARPPRRWTVVAAAADVGRLSPPRSGYGCARPRTHSERNRKARLTLGRERSRNPLRLIPTLPLTPSTLATRTFSNSPAPLRRKLREALSPTELEVENDSAKHAGHAGNPGGGPDAETHFNVRVVSAAFAGQRLVARHRTINGLLRDEFAAGLHALSMKTLAPGE